MDQTSMRVTILLPVPDGDPIHRVNNLTFFKEGYVALLFLVGLDEPDR